jgi:hypothetical protein
MMKPKDKGGLGVINLWLQNDALLLKQLSKFYNKEDIPWKSWFGANIMTPKYPMVQGKWAPFGGRMCYASIPSLEELPSVN